MRARAVWGVALPAAALLLAGCTGDPDPVTPVTPSASTSSATATAEPSPSPSVSLPLSALEDDPGVQLVREHLREYAQVINDGGTAQDMADTSTPTRIEALTEMLPDEAGLTYPGPVPWTPVEVVLDTPERRDIMGCVYNGGYAVDPATGEPTGPLEKIAGQAVLVLVDGAWKVEGFYSEDLVDPPDCTTIEVQEVPW